MGLGLSLIRNCGTWVITVKPNLKVIRRPLTKIQNTSTSSMLSTGNEDRTISTDVMILFIAMYIFSYPRSLCKKCVGFHNKLKNRIISVANMYPDVVITMLYNIVRYVNVFDFLWFSFRHYDVFSITSVMNDTTPIVMHIY